ncbi:MAG TPA: VOC family protein [Sandaracinaceae bacterium LLY-WYZ-13_1]|nr:VOC family protein [Sandaracinaceae bacterium LLY-WYZ-13_1]
MKPLVSGIQQIGVGVPDVDRAFAWARRALGADLPLFDDAAPAPLMTRYTGGEVHRRRALLAANLRGGGGLELWRFESRAPARLRPVRLDERGLLLARVKALDVRAFAAALGPSVRVPPTRDAAGRLHAVAEDPFGNLYDVTEADDWFARRAGPRGTFTGGVAGAVLGVGDLERAVVFYRDLLGYRVAREDTGPFPELAGLPGADRLRARVRMAHEPEGGAFAPLLGATTLDLVRADAPGRHVRDDRLWGDPGYMHLCFDVRGTDALKARFAAAGHPFTVDSAEGFDMGQASGRFAYAEDPDGTLVELVEAYTLDVLPRLGLRLDLRDRAPAAPLPWWMLRALGLGRVRDEPRAARASEDAATERPRARARAQRRTRPARTPDR